MRNKMPFHYMLRKNESFSLETNINDMLFAHVEHLKHYVEQSC